MSPLSFLLLKLVSRCREAQSSWQGMVWVLSSDRVYCPACLWPSVPPSLPVLLGISADVTCTCPLSINLARLFLGSSAPFKDNQAPLGLLTALQISGLVVPPSECLTWEVFFAALGTGSFPPFAGTLLNIRSLIPSPFFHIFRAFDDIRELQETWCHYRCSLCAHKWPFLHCSSSFMLA